MYRHVYVASESMVFHMLSEYLRTLRKLAAPGGNADVCASQTNSALGGNAARRVAVRVVLTIQMWSIALTTRPVSITSTLEGAGCVDRQRCP
jgi:hypothetical protein